jgi:hypothetical protein
MVQEIQNPLNVTLDGEWIEFRQIPERDLMAFIRFVCLFTVFESAYPLNILMIPQKKCPLAMACTPCMIPSRSPPEVCMLRRDLPALGAIIIRNSGFSQSALLPKPLAMVFSTALYIIFIMKEYGD